MRTSFPWEAIHSVIPTVPKRLLKPEAVSIAAGFKHRRMIEIRDTWDGHSSRIILGKTRLGKSLAFAMAARRFATARLLGKESVRVYWCRADELSNARNEDLEMLERAKRAELTIIDDWGWQAPHLTRVLNEVVGARYDRDLPIVITSGLTNEDLFSQVGDAMLARLTEVGGGGIVNLWKGEL